MTEDNDILQEAIRRFPIGTKFTCPFEYFDDKKVYEIENIVFWQGNGISHFGIPWVYYDGQWANIVEEVSTESNLYEIY